MITPEEKQEIVNSVLEVVKPMVYESEDKAVERSLLLLPDTMGNLMAQVATTSKINRDFISKYPEFKNHALAAKAVIEKVEGKNPLMKYEDILEKAVPEIRERIKTVEKLDSKTVPHRPNLTFNGEI